MVRTNSTNLFGLSEFIVDQTASKGSYTTVQAALDAVSAIGNGVIYIKGDGAAYIEDLVFNSDVQLIGVSADGRLPQVLIAGTHTFADGVTVAISNLFMTANGNPSLFTLNPTAVGLNTLAIKNCDLLNNTGTIITSNPTAGAACAILVELCQCNSTSHMFVSTGLGSGTVWNLRFGNYETSGVGRFFDLSGNDQAYVNGVQAQLGGEAFMMNGASNSVQCSISQITSDLFSYAAPLGGVITTSDTVYICGDPSGFFVTGSPSFNYSGITLTGTARDINGTVGDFPATWKPFATAGNSGTAVRGTAGFDDTNFSMVDGFVSALNPVLSASVTLTSAEVKSLRATPITILPPVGAGNTPYVLFARCKLNYGGTNPFTNPQNLNIQLNNGTGTNLLEGVLGTGFIDQSADMYQDVIINAGTKIYTDTELENASIVIHNVGASEITGNAANDNTLVVTIIYRVLTQ